MIVKYINSDHQLGRGSNITVRSGTFLNLSCLTIDPKPSPSIITWRIGNRVSSLHAASAVHQKVKNGSNVYFGNVHVNIIPAYHGKVMTCQHDIEGLKFEQSIILDVECK